jgi:glutamate/tyrosine decarboxylase-like PLP-dependent enzyme
MLGHPGDGWAHLTGGGTIANLEALWVARSVKYLPLAVAEARRALGLEATGDIHDPADRARLLATPSLLALADYAALFKHAAERLGSGPATLQMVQEALLRSRFNPAQRGMASVIHSLGSSPVLLVPETHHYCFEKAMDVLGLGRDALVSIRVDPDFRMRVDDLEARLIESERQGRHVLAVVAVVGTTEEGAVDPVDQILALRTALETSGRGSFWIHADAAYGGYLRTLTVPTRAGLGPPITRVQVGGSVRNLALDLPHRQACDALERLGECDSITIDPHKLGYIPYPAGCVCFRSNLVKPLARQHAPYLADDAGDPQTEARSDSIGLYVLEGSKPGAAAAAVWLSHTLIPLNGAGHGALVRQTIRNACELHALLDQYPRLSDATGALLPVRAVCLCPPGSNIVCYAFAPVPGVPCSLRQLNAANEAIYRRFSVHPGQRVTDQPFFVSRTTLSSARYAPDTVADFLRRLSVPGEQYAGDGVFLLRSVLMNPWYDQAKERGRYFLSELVGELYAAAAEEFAALGAGAAPNAVPHPQDPAAVREFSSPIPIPPPPATPLECCPSFRSNACRPMSP